MTPEERGRKTKNIKQRLHIASDAEIDKIDKIIFLVRQTKPEKNGKNGQIPRRPSDQFQKQ